MNRCRDNVEKPKFVTKLRFGECLTLNLNQMDTTHEYNELKE